MDVLDAIMKIVADLFNMNNIPDATSNTIISAITGFFKAILFIFDLLQKLFAGAGA